MAERVVWKQPDEDTITKVYIYRSNTIYGTYAEIANIDATSDGAAKSSSNTWVTTYTDVTGLRTHWYKVRFYDGTSLLFSEYSEPITTEELLKLCTVANVRETIETVGRWTDDEIFEAITNVDDLIYIECGTPLKAMYSDIGKIDTTVQTRYYVGEENIYRTDRVFYGTVTRTELFLDDGYRANLKYGMVEILPVASSGVTPDTTCLIEVDYVPMIYHKLSLYRTCENLLEKLDTTSGGTTSKELEVIQRKLEKVETLLSHSIGVQLSSDFELYDKVYGVNKKKIIQNHNRNKYVGSYGWT